MGHRIDATSGSSGAARAARPTFLGLVGLAIGLVTTQIPGIALAARAATLVAGWTVVTVGLRPGPEARQVVSVACWPRVVCCGSSSNATIHGSAPASRSPSHSIASAVAPVVIIHALLRFPVGRLASRPQRIAVAGAYLSAVGLLGVGPAVVFDPRSHGCAG